MRRPETGRQGTLLGPDVAAVSRMTPGTRVWAMKSPMLRVLVTPDMKSKSSDWRRRQDCTLSRIAEDIRMERREDGRVRDLVQDSIRSAIRMRRLV
jgi:hypothetical protein